MDPVLVRAGVERFLRPATVGEAYDLLGEYRPSARLVGGGTDLAIHPPAGLATLIDLSELALSDIEEDEGAIVIGATTTLTALLESRRLAGFASGVLPRVLAELGAPALRNVATIGGHVVRAKMSDLIPVLLVLDAEVRFFDGTDRSMPLGDFYDQDVHHRDGLVVTAVRLPPASAIREAAFHRFARAAFDFAMLNVAAACELTDGVVSQARIAVGETPRLARRVQELEDRLAGTALGDDEIERIAQIARSVVMVGDDQRATAGYRTQLVSVGLRRCLRAVAGRPEPEP